MSTSECMIDYTRRVRSGSRDLFTFWQTSDNISETVEDGHTVTTRSTGTVHTSAKARLTSVAIQIRIRIQIHIRIRDPNRHQNFTICSLAHCQSLTKISCKSVWKFLHKVANRQTNRHTKNYNYISSLVKAMKQQQKMLRCLSDGTITNDFE